MRKLLLVAALIMVCGSAEAHPACAPVAVASPAVSSNSGWAAGASALFPALQIAIVTAPAWINSSLIEDGASALGLKTYPEYP